MTQQDTLQTNFSDSTLPVWYHINLMHDAAMPDLTSSTSVLQADSSALHQRKFFVSRDVHAGSHQQIKRNDTDNDWLYGSFALILFLIVLLKIAWSKHINTLFHSIVLPFRNPSDSRFFEFRFDLFSILFFLIYGMIFSLLLISFLQKYHGLPLIFSNNAAGLFFVFSLSFVLLLAIKVFLVWVSSRIFFLKKAGIQYQDYLLTSAFVSSALILPLIVINAFSASLVFILVALIIMIVMIIVRIFRNFVGGITLDSFSFLHFILYFCTLEILPLLLFGKIIFSLMSK